MPDLLPAWSDALLAARVLAAGGRRLGGIHMRARFGPVRTIWLDYFRSQLATDIPWLRLVPPVPAGRLIGELDVAATLAAGRPVNETGILERADGGVVTLALAERTDIAMAAILGQALDEGKVTDQTGSRVAPARLTLLALDEGSEDDEVLSPALADRLALRIDLNAIGVRDAILPETERTPLACNTFDDIAIDDEMMEALVAAAARFSGRSMRHSLALPSVTRIIAGLDGCDRVDQSHAAAAIRLVFATSVGAAGEEQAADGESKEERETPPPDDGPLEEDGDDEATVFDPKDLADMLIATREAKRPDALVISKPGRERAERTASSGKSGALMDRSRRGRPTGYTDRQPYPGARPNIIATLRAAAPWQRLRREAEGKSARWSAGEPLSIRPSDFRYIRFRHHTESTAIFAVDASGSTALDRLGEAKGAIELLLADCYVRRDQVALVAFRGDSAEILLEPTRSLVRAKRSLTGLPGGGATPLASGIMQSLELAVQTRRNGHSPLLILLSDGKGNIALDGTADRTQARSDAEQIGRRGAALGIKSVVVDIARRPRDDARSLAEAMGADYCQLPNADAVSVSNLVAGYLKTD